MQWDAVEDKTSVFVYGAGAVTLLWLSSTLVGAINHVPVVRFPFRTSPLLCCAFIAARLDADSGPLRLTAQLHLHFELTFQYLVLPLVMDCRHMHRIA